MGSLPNHLGFRVHQGFGGVGHFDELSDRVVSLSNHSGGWFGEVGRFDELSDRLG